MNLSKTNWAENIRASKYLYLCVSCHKEAATEVIATTIDYKKPGIIETALCSSCYNKLARTIDD